MDEEGPGPADDEPRQEGEDRGEKRRSSSQGHGKPPRGEGGSYRSSSARHRRKRREGGREGGREGQREGCQRSRRRGRGGGRWAESASDLDYSVSEDFPPSDPEERVGRYCRRSRPRRYGDITVLNPVGIGPKRARKMLAVHTTRSSLHPMQARPLEEMQRPSFPMLLPDGMAHCPPLGHYTQDRTLPQITHSEVLFEQLRPETRLLSQRMYHEFTRLPDLHRRSVDSAAFSGSSLDFCQLWDNFVDAFAGYITAEQTFLACCLFVKLHRDLLWGPMRTHFAIHLTVLAQAGRLSSMDVCSLMGYFDGDPDVVQRLDPLLKFWPESLAQFLTECRINGEPDLAGAF